MAIARKSEYFLFVLKVLSLSLSLSLSSYALSHIISLPLSLLSSSLLSPFPFRTECQRENIWREPTRVYLLTTDSKPSLLSLSQRK